jgi:hypothetical protein
MPDVLQYFSRQGAEDRDAPKYQHPGYRRFDDDCAAAQSTSGLQNCVA